MLQKMSIAVFSRMGFMRRCIWWWHLISFLKISPMGFGGRCKSGATDWEEEGTKAAVQETLASPHPHTPKNLPTHPKKLTHPNKKDPTNEICSHYYKEKSQQSSQWSLTLSLPLSLSFFFHCYCHFILVGWSVGRYSIILNQMFQSSQVSRFPL